MPLCRGDSAPQPGERDRQGMTAGMTPEQAMVYAALPVRMASLTGDIARFTGDLDIRVFQQVTSRDRTLTLEETERISGFVNPLFLGSACLEGVTMVSSMRPGWRSFAASALLVFSGVFTLGTLAVPVAAHAATVDFEAVGPNLYAPGESFSSQTMQFTVDPVSPGFAVVDSAASLSLFGNAPTGNATQYLAGFNDAALTLTSSAGAFYLQRFDYAFIPPVLFPNTGSPGSLVVLWTDTLGRTGASLHDFGTSDASGAWAFQSASFASGLGGGPLLLRSVSLFACLYTAGGTCEWPADNLAQFAVDNVVVSPIPEPTTLALLTLGVLALVVRRRWQAR